MIADTINDRYCIREKLGEGGMANVYRTYDTRLGHEVAIKFMKSTLLGAAQKRFAREFQTLSKIDRPHCIRVFEFGENAGGPFFTMELLSSRPITVLRDRPTSMQLQALYQGACALEYLHHRGMVHRDVKPSNLLIGTDPDTQTHIDRPSQPVSRVLFGEVPLVARTDEAEQVERWLHSSLSPSVASRANWSLDPTPSVLFVTGQAGAQQQRQLNSSEEVRSLVASIRHSSPATSERVWTI